jgi:hypothetical protein
MDACGRWNQKNILILIRIHELLINKLNEIDPDANKDNVKILSLTAFERNFKKKGEKKSIAGVDDISHPNLCYSSVLLFLDHRETPWKSVKNVSSGHDDKVNITT